jgi:rhodanese-related sulfurtransferase
VTERDTVPRISRDELAAALSSDHPPALFEVLGRGYWLKHHLPGAINAPPNEAVAIITAQVPDHDADIVVYCWDPG